MKDNYNNIIPCNDFSNQQDILNALQYMLDNKWNKIKTIKIIAFAFQSNTGELMPEKDFYKIAVKVDGAPKLMAQIAEKAFNTHSITYCYNADTLTNAFTDLFYQLILNNKEYFELGWRFCNTMDRDHEIGECMDILDISMRGLDKNERMKYYEKYPDVREWLEDKGHGL